MTVFRSGEQVEEYTDDAIWELMYFGTPECPRQTAPRRERDRCDIR